MMRPETYNFPDNEVLKNETELLVTALMTPNMFRGGKHNCSSQCIFHKGKRGGKPCDFNTTSIRS